LLGLAAGWPSVGDCRPLKSAASDRNSTPCRATPTLPREGNNRDALPRAGGIRITMKGWPRHGDQRIRACDEASGADPCNAFSSTYAGPLGTIFSHYKRANATPIERRMAIHGRGACAIRGSSAPNTQEIDILFKELLIGERVLSRPTLCKQLASVTFPNYAHRVASNKKHEHGGG